MQQEKDTISVIIPAYNCARYIEESIRSVLAQTLPAQEVIVIDDGSVDETPSVLRRLAGQYPQIRLYHNGGNKGVSYTRNRGVEVASGKWIAFLDGDDQWTVDKLEKQLRFLKEKEGDFAFTGSAYVDSQGKPFESTFSVPETVNREQLLDQNVISCSSVLIRRDVIRRFPMKSEDIHEDFDCWLRVLGEVPVAYGLNEPLLIYRISTDSKSGNKLKSFFMNYRTYRSVGLNPISAAKHMYWYTKNGLKKYRDIKK